MTKEFLLLLLASIMIACGSASALVCEKLRLSRPADDAGRPMRAYKLSDYTLGSEEVLLMSDYNPASFDGRYFGPLPRTTIQSVIVQVITWK